MTNRRQFVQALGGAAALGALHPLAALAQAVQQAKIYYGFPAGSAGDSVARRVAEKLGDTPYSKINARTSPARADASRSTRSRARRPTARCCASRRLRRCRPIRTSIPS